MSSKRILFRSSAALVVPYRMTACTSWYEQCKSQLQWKQGIMQSALVARLVLEAFC